MILLVLKTIILFGGNSFPLVNINNDTIKYPYFQVSLDDTSKVEAVFSIPQYKELKVAVLSVTNCYDYASRLELKIDTLNKRVDTLQTHRETLLLNINKLEKINKLQSNKIESLDTALEKERSNVSLLKTTYNLLYLDHTKLQASKTKWKTIAITTLTTIGAVIIYTATN